jgi:hypothetical protein
MKIEIRKQNRKSLSARLLPSGDVLVSIPNWVRKDDPGVKAFIKDALKQLEPHMPLLQPVQLHDAKALRVMVRRWARRMGLEVNRVTFRAMVNKWGSCSGRGNITLNTALFYVPELLAEYVVVHELAHLRVFHHGPEFWAVVAEFMPDYEEREMALSDYPV